MAEVNVNLQRKFVARTPAKRKEQRFTGKCASLIKEQRARLYVLRRCATMLLCWIVQQKQLYGFMGWFRCSYNLLFMCLVQFFDPIGEISNGFLGTGVEVHGCKPGPFQPNYQH